MASRELPLEARARRAYELGRLRLGLRRGLLVLPVLLASLALGRRDPAMTLALSAALFAMVTALGWRGGAAARAVWPGLGAGAAPMLAPLLVMAAGAHTCADCGLASADFRACLAACVGGGLLAGAVIGWHAARQAEGQRLGVAAWAMAVAALTGSIGCLVIGHVGVIGLGAGLLFGGAPVALLSPRLR